MKMFKIVVTILVLVLIGYVLGVCWMGWKSGKGGG